MIHPIPEQFHFTYQQKRSSALLRYLLAGAAMQSNGLLLWLPKAVTEPEPTKWAIIPTFSIYEMFGDADQEPPKIRYEHRFVETWCSVPVYDEGVVTAKYAYLKDNLLVPAERGGRELWCPSRESQDWLRGQLSWCLAQETQAERDKTRFEEGSRG